MIFPMRERVIFVQTHFRGFACLNFYQDFSWTYFLNETHTILSILIHFSLYFCSYRTQHLGRSRQPCPPTVQANVVDRDIGSFVAEAQAALAEVVQLPPGYVISWGGQFELQQQANRRLAVVVPVTLALISIMLYLSFGSIKNTASNRANTEGPRMIYILIKLFISSGMIVVVSEVAKRSGPLGEWIATLPLTSILAILRLYQETGSIEKINSLTPSIFWFLLPSLVFFLARSLLLRWGFIFWMNLAVSCVLTTTACLEAVGLLDIFKGD